MTDGSGERDRMKVVKIVSLMGIIGLNLALAWRAAWETFPTVSSFRSPAIDSRCCGIMPGKKRSTSLISTTG